MIRTIIFTFIIFCSNTARSQWAINFTPSLVNTHSAHFGLQFGSQYMFNDKWDLVTEFTTAVGWKGDNPSVTNQQYFRIKPELRYFVVKRKANTGGYIGLQLSYTFRNWKDIDGGNYFEEKLFEDSTITFQTASVRSPVYTSSVQAGSVIPLGQHFRLDLFMGIGVRIIDTKYSDLENKGKAFSQEPKCQILIAPDPAYLVNGTVTRPHFNLGIRLIYRL